MGLEMREGKTRELGRRVEATWGARCLPVVTENWSSGQEYVHVPQEHSTDTSQLSACGLFVATLCVRNAPCSSGGLMLGGCLRRPTLRDTGSHSLISWGEDSLVVPKLVDIFIRESSKPQKGGTGNCGGQQGSQA
jgi:hypothetical protein